MNRFNDFMWALSDNNRLKEIFLEVYRDNIGYLEYLDSLINSLRKGKCKQIREKVSEADNLSKFRSIISELEIARLLISYGKSVTLLLDRYMCGKPSPDMLVSDKIGEAYVEVKRFTEDEIVDNHILKPLEDFLNESEYCFRVKLELNECLTQPALTNEERKEKEDYAKRILTEFKTRFVKTATQARPLSIDVEETKFSLYDTRVKLSFVGEILTKGTTVPDDRLIKEIGRDICQKAKKRRYWQGYHLKNFFIVAIDFELIVVDDVILDATLIGDRVFVSKPLPMPKIRLSKDVQEARKRGWEQFLRQQCITPNNRTYLKETKKGIFFTRKEVKHLSAVLVRFANRKHYFMPNPFAHDEINDPKLTNYLCQLSSFCNNR